MPKPLLSVDDFDEWSSDSVDARQRRLDGIIADIRSYCGWHIAPARDEALTVSGRGGHVLALKSLRVNDVTSVVENGVPLAIPQTVQWDEVGLLKKPHACWTTAYRGVVVTLNHGHPELPEEIVAVAFDVLERALEVPSSTPVSETAGKYSRSFGSPRDGVIGGMVMTPAQRAILDRYRR